MMLTCLTNWLKCLELPNSRVRKYRRVFLCYILPLTVLLTLTLGSQNRFGAFMPSCTPQKKIAFLKTHKCASSTIQNILFRYGETHELNFVFPLEGNYLGRSQQFQKRMIESVPWHKLGYDIFAVHTMWNTGEIKSLLGYVTQKPILISIVRDPVDLFESLYSFAQWDKLFRMDINKFARAININATGSADFLTVGGYTGHNQMLHDFGLTERNTTNLEIVTAKILEIERDFDLVMVAEHMDESLVLLKQILCWTLNDVTSLPLNERQSQFRRTLEPEARVLLRRWLWADQMLYNHFLDIFKKNTIRYGVRRLAMETEKLKILNSELREHCSVAEGDYKNLKGDFRPSSFRVKGFEVSNNAKCKNLARSELAYIDLLRQRQILQAQFKLNYSIPLQMAPKVQQPIFRRLDKTPNMSMYSIGYDYY